MTTIVVKDLRKVNRSVVAVCRPPFSDEAVDITDVRPWRRDLPVEFERLQP